MPPAGVLVVELLEIHESLLPRHDARARCGGSQVLFSRARQHGNPMSEPDLDPIDLPPVATQRPRRSLSAATTALIIVMVVAAIVGSR